MDAIKITVTGAQAQVENAPVLTCGMVGVPVELKFDAAWDGLQKTLVYKAGSVIRSQVGVDTTGTVASEVLQIPYRNLQIGVYGASADGALVIPTVWANAGQIREGVDPSGDISTQPALPVWQQILNRITALDDCAVKTVNGIAPDKNGNVQVETGGGGIEVFKVEVDFMTDSMSPSRDEVIAAIRAGKFIEVHEYDEAGVERVSYGWRCEYDYDEESDTEYTRYYVGDYSFADRDFDEGGEDEGGEEITPDTYDVYFAVRQSEETGAYTLHVTCSEDSVWDSESDSPSVDITLHDSDSGKVPSWSQAHFSAAYDEEEYGIYATVYGVEYGPAEYGYENTICFESDIP